MGTVLAKPREPYHRNEVSKTSNAWLWTVIGRLAFNRIMVLDKQHLPVAGPAVYVATHRNGALDAAAYNLTEPLAVPMISAQLQRGPLGRFLFQGIAVARDKDRARGIEADNARAMRDCVQLLREGGRVFVMPEGTSSLGPRHQPYHRGAARIVRAAMDAGVTPVIAPLAVHYDDPTVWQSRVEVLVGAPLTPRAEHTVADLHSAITQALEGVGANFAGAEAQDTAEILAYAAAGQGLSFARTLKYLEAGVPPEALEIFLELQHLARRERLWLHRGLPLAVSGPLPPAVLNWLMLAPVVLLFSLCNLPVLAAAYMASRKLPDAANVISFWRMTIGLPVGVVWSACLSLALAGGFGVSGPLAYGLTTLAGIMAWRRFRVLTAALANTLLHPGARPVLSRAYNTLLIRLQYE